MRKWMSFLVVLCLPACTLNLIQTDTHGTASDVVDSDPRTDPTVDANANVTLPIAPSPFP